jgi:hypothetical protein
MDADVHPQAVLSYATSSSRDPVALRTLAWIALATSLLLIGRLFIDVIGLTVLDLPPWLQAPKNYHFTFPGIWSDYLKYWWMFGRCVNGLTLLAGSLGILRRYQPAQKWLILFSVIEVSLSILAFSKVVSEVPLWTLSTDLEVVRAIKKILQGVNTIVPSLILPIMLLRLTLVRDAHKRLR